MITIRNLSQDNIEAALALSVDDWQRKYVRTNAEMIALAYVQPQELFPVALYAEEALVGLAFVKKEQKTAIMTLEQIMIGLPIQKFRFRKRKGNCEMDRDPIRLHAAAGIHPDRQPMGTGNARKRRLHEAQHRSRKARNRNDLHHEIMKSEETI